MSGVRRHSNHITTTPFMDHRVWCFAPGLSLASTRVNRTK